jgi:Short C-terminal domain
MRSIKYISGTLGDKYTSDFLGNPVDNSDSSIRTSDFLVLENIMYRGKALVITRRKNPNSPEEEVEKLKPILGLGLREAFRKAAAAIKNHSARSDKDVASLTPLEANVFANRSETAMLIIAGVALMGPLGALAGLAAKKKGETVFALEFKGTAEDETLRGQTIIASCPTELFETLKKDSRAPSKPVKEQIEKAGTASHEEDPRSLTMELEKLKNLRDSGVITEEEFTAGKATLLGM